MRAGLANEGGIGDGGEGFWPPPCLHESLRWFCRILPLQNLY